MNLLIGNPASLKIGTVLTFSINDESQDPELLLLISKETAGKLSQRSKKKITVTTRLCSESLDYSSFGFILNYQRTTT